MKSPMDSMSEASTMAGPDMSPPPGTPDGPDMSDGPDMPVHPLPKKDDEEMGTPVPLTKERR